MKIIYRFRFLLLPLILVSTMGCEDKNDSDPEPEIAWTSGARVVYSYSSGSLAGFRAILNFEVINDQPGEIKITASHGGVEKSCVFFVEPGQQYSVTVYCDIGSGGEKGSIIVSSKSASKSFTISSQYRTILKKMTCPH